jgi:hypothetical protein
MRSLRCLVGKHSWRIERTDEGEEFRRCARCHNDRSDPVEVQSGGRAKDAYSRATGFFGGSGG